jgi:hypothetical protein
MPRKDEDEMANRTQVEMPDVVTEAREALARGSERLVASNCSLRDAWFPIGTTPSCEEQLLSDYGALHRGNPIAAEFEEEVSALIEAIARRSDQRSLKEIDSHEGEKAMMSAATERMGRRPLALNLWDMHGAPVRLKGSHVFRVISPNDAMGDPIIRAYPAERYVTEVSVKTAEMTCALARMRTALFRWRIAAAGLLGGIVLLLWLLITRA